MQGVPKLVMQNLDVITKVQNEQYYDSCITKCGICLSVIYRMHSCSIRFPLFTQHMSIP